MGFLSWLIEKILGPPSRDVSRLDGAGPDVVQEAVDRSGGPLKPGHLRKTPRDRRLWPKRNRRDLMGLGKRKRYMTAAEANRLFSATLRSKDRNIRDLLADEEQLARYGLPVWRDEKELAAALGISVGELRHYSVHREMDKVTHYVCFAPRPPSASCSTGRRASWAKRASRSTPARPA